MEYKDAFGNEINIGDLVAYVDSGKFPDIKKGIIKKFTPKGNIVIEFSDRKWHYDSQTGTGHFEDCINSISREYKRVLKI